MPKATEHPNQTCSQTPDRTTLAAHCLPTMPEFIDDKSEHCIPFLLERLRVHRERHAGQASPPTFFLGLNGVQGAGKTTLVRSISSRALMSAARRGQGRWSHHERCFRILNLGFPIWVTRTRPRSIRQDTRSEARAAHQASDAPHTSDPKLPVPYAPSNPSNPP